MTFDGLSMCTGKTIKYNLQLQFSMDIFFLPVQFKNAILLQHLHDFLPSKQPQIITEKRA